MQVGRSATDQDSRAGSGEVWIKGFKPGETRFRIVQPVTTVKDPRTGEVVQQGWHFYLEHYKVGIGYFGCTEDGDCRGCSDPDPKVADRNKRYAFNAIDESGRLSVFKVGPSVYKVMKSREQRLDTLMDRDYKIIKSGSGLDTMYEVEAGDRYPVDIPEELHDIGAILVNKIVNDVIPAYDGETEQAEPESPPVLDTEKAQPAFEDMATAEIVSWLTERDVKVPPRTSRSKLIRMAQDVPQF